MDDSKKYEFIDANIVADITRKTRKNDSEAKEYLNFQIFSDNKYPTELIDKQRPNEQLEVKRYRKEIYQPVFSEVFDRVLNALGKIFRSDGFFLKYPDQSQFTKISENEKLDVYLTKHFTHSQSLMNWCSQVALKQYIIDANGVCIIWANNTNDPTAYKKPLPYIVNIDQIIYYYEGYSIIYKGEERDEYFSLDAFSWSKYKKNKSGKIIIEEQILHGLGVMPAFTLGGFVEEEEELGREYESRFKAMLPWLNVATIEFSDLQAEITMHMHSKEWAYQDEQCPDCRGMGYGINKQNEKVPCTNVKCKGGYVGHSPYDVIRVRPAVTSQGETPAPIPPGGYIQKQTEIARLQAERIDAHRYRALSAVNMQFLEQSPVAQSGVAKAYDRDETNNTFYGVATDLAQIMEKAAYFVAKWRYNLLYDDKEIRAMSPMCVVPNTFDIVGAQYLLDEVKQSKDSGLNDSVISEIEIEFIKKRFPNDTRLQNTLIDSYSLDPMSGLTEDEKALLISNKGATKQDYIISTYISDFIQRAYDEQKDFNKLERKQQYQTLLNYADEKLKDINIKDKMVSKIFGIDTNSASSSGGKSPADLKYTVGGLTGIIEIVKAVSSGVYDLEAAIQMVMDRFGLTYDQAKAQLGTPAIISSEADLNKVIQLT